MVACYFYVCSLFRYPYEYSSRIVNWRRENDACPMLVQRKEVDNEYCCSKRFLFIYMVNTLIIHSDRFQRMLEAMPGFLLMGREGSNSQEETLSE